MNSHNSDHFTDLYIYCIGLVKWNSTVLLNISVWTRQTHNITPWTLPKIYFLQFHVRESPITVISWQSYITLPNHKRFTSSYYLLYISFDRLWNIFHIFPIELQETRKRFFKQTTWFLWYMLKARQWFIKVL